MARAGVPVPPVPDPAQCHHPSLAALAERARLIRGTGPVDGAAVDWVCNNTAEHNGGGNVTNRPIDNFLLKLPALYCSGCRKLNPVGYRWKITQCTLGRIGLDFLIRNQGPHNTCVAHAILSGMDLMYKIHTAYQSRAFVGRPLSMQDFFMKFSHFFKVSFGYERNPALEIDRALCVIYIAQQYGVRLSAPSLTTWFEWQQESNDKVMMGSFFHVPSNDTELIIRLIAGGYPLICGVPSGRTFKFTSADEIYDGGRVPTNHCVLLIGSGVFNYPGNPDAIPRHTLGTWPLNRDGRRGPRVCLGARGSWGSQVHGSSSQEGGGGDFYIWADQIDRVMGFHIEGMY
ncbi:hypothetical protein CFC21_095761 [Triticum aestivum]|uniref:Peptidase C1A papain C-terminal domain-containing protein n=2 Tax=Triticum aestivum TaxID=4565 RepID=A0A3B6R8W9_WHEAT|nr:uncharacterized protein LOC123149244 [Triticum aestivum]KAF7093345.1 hypothetical protein CFC21_095761 [Triticum aestivum]